MISSASNGQIKNIVKLQKQSKIRNDQGVFICEGRKMVEEAASQKRDLIQKVYLTESFMKENNILKSELLKDLDYEIIADHVMKEASETLTPQGILAIVKQPAYDLTSILLEDKIRLLVLEDIRDPGNLGTMMRTAEAAGMTGIVLSQTSVDMYNPKVIRSTMGAIFRVPFVYTSDLEEVMLRLKSAGCKLYAAHLSGALWYDQVDYRDNIALIIGNEAKGLSDRISELSTNRVKIPMEGKVESLNAAIAATVLMYETYRQLRNQ